MADEPVVDGGTQPTQVDPQVEAEARRGGWKPKEQFHGDGWVDAATFVARGREVLPHVQREARRLELENQKLRERVDAQAAEQATLKQQVDGLTTFRADMAKREYERIRGELATELAAARAAGDTQAEARILGQLSAPPPAPAPAPAKVDPPAPPRAQIPQEMTDWVAQNDWYTKDKVLAQAMNVVGAELRQRGEFEGLSLTDQLNATSREVLRRYAPSRGNGNSQRVEGGGRPSGPQGGGQAVEGTFEALSAQAKAECDAQGERMGLVGKGKAFPTLAEWRTHYAHELSRYAPGIGYDYRPPGN